MNCIFCQGSTEYNHNYKDYYCYPCRCLMRLQDDELLDFAISNRGSFIDVDVKNNITSINYEDLYFIIPIATNSINDYYNLVMNKFNKLKAFK